MVQLLEILFVRTWWIDDAQEPFRFSQLYHWFNLAEGLVWMACSGLVLLRFTKHRKSPTEICYGLLFATFGVSDFVEAWQQSSWLIWLKLFNLCWLRRLRTRVMIQCYPEAKLY